MKALVTGATGYLGLHLCRHLLDQDWQVHALVRLESDAGRVAALTPARIHRLADGLSNLPGIVAAVAPDAVFNLAAAMPGADGGLAIHVLADLSGTPGAAYVRLAMVASTVFSGPSTDTLA